MKAQALFFVACLLTASVSHADTAADKINAEYARMNLEHFSKHLSDCPENEIRCLWFLEDHIRVGMVMTLDIHRGSVHTVRDVFNHAMQVSETRELSHSQNETAKKLVSELPLGKTGVPFSEGLHISFWRDKKLHMVAYSRKAVPRIVQRLYDVGGGYGDFIYKK